jgi:hypothetical protein
MNCPDRVAGHGGGERVNAAELTRNLPRPRSLDPNFTDWDPEDMGTWDGRIVVVANDENFLDWQRDWLAENGRG